MKTDRLYIVKPDLVMEDDWGCLYDCCIINTNIDRCDKCRIPVEDIIRCDYLMPGHDDYKLIDKSTKRQFITGDATPPFIFHERHLGILSGLLTGTEVVRVGYHEWDQSPIKPKERFTRKPILYCLIETSVCNKIIDKATGKEPPQCPKCNKYYDYTFVHRENDILVDKNAWNGDDVFVVPGFEETFITETGKNKLDKAGFTNLCYTEIGWA